MKTESNVTPIVEPKELPFEAVLWRIIVELKTPETHFAGGLLEKAEETKEVESANEYQGTVVSVGPLAYLDPVKFSPRGIPQRSACKVGDIVTFNRYGGKAMRTKDGREFRVMDDEDIFSVVHDPDALREPY